MSIGVDNISFVTLVAKAAIGRRLEELCATASELRDREKGRIISFSPKVFIPLTQLCRDFCSYCTYRQSPNEAQHLYMTPEEILKVAKAGEERGCREALFVLGERPEQRYAAPRRWLHDHGYDSSLHYLYEMCKLILRESALYPHSNPGTMTHREMMALKEVNASLGLMLESSSVRLCDKGGPHEHAPSKRPQVRLTVLRRAGELKIPFTTGLLIGIGETMEERLEALRAIADLHKKYGHIQEVIIQNFRSKPDTPMGEAPEPSIQEILETVAMARLTLGGEMNIQVPPNLSMHNGKASYLVYLKGGINDWGGISPLTIDYVNPEAPWPHIVRMRRQMIEQGFELRARFPVYPEYILQKSDYLPESVKRRLHSEADSQGYIRGRGMSNDECRMTNVE
ncbi:MAG: 7,8-didemethyl-8-hydroxy-5-deazariboflavin synthase CofG [Acidobacteriota bacterium]